MLWFFMLLLWLFNGVGHALCSRPVESTYAVSALLPETFCLCGPACTAPVISAGNVSNRDLSIDLVVACQKETKTQPSSGSLHEVLPITRHMLCFHLQEVALS